MNRAGMMEYWNIGIMGGRAVAPPTFDYSTIPLFQSFFGVMR
jgi:hypothetical protein